MLPLQPGCEEVVRGEIPQPTDQERQEDSGRAILLQQVAILNSTKLTIIIEVMTSTTFDCNNVKS